MGSEVCSSVVDSICNVIKSNTSLTSVSLLPVVLAIYNGTYLKTLRASIDPSPHTIGFEKGLFTYTDLMKNPTILYGKNTDVARENLSMTLSRVRSWRSLKILSIGRSYPVPNLELYQWSYSTFHPVKPSTIDLYVLGNQHCLQRDFNHFNSLFANFCAESSEPIMDDVVVPEDVHCVDEVVDEVIVDNVDKQIIENYDNQIIDFEKIV
ncbi:hypothetical protein GEMRC1_010497 [Eukaryota sp. GEM-RC1]